MAKQTDLTFQVLESTKTFFGKLHLAVFEKGEPILLILDYGDDEDWEIWEALDLLLSGRHPDDYGFEWHIKNKAKSHKTDLRKMLETDNTIKVIADNTGFYPKRMKTDKARIRILKPFLNMAKDILRRAEKVSWDFSHDNFNSDNLRHQYKKIL
jgi:hypothetical protein